MSEEKNYHPEQSDGRAFGLCVVCGKSFLDCPCHERCTCGKDKPPYFYHFETDRYEGGGYSFYSDIKVDEEELRNEFRQTFLEIYDENRRFDKFTEEEKEEIKDSVKEMLESDNNSINQEEWIKHFQKSISEQNMLDYMEQCVDTTIEILKDRYHLKETTNTAWISTVDEIETILNRRF